MASILFGVAVVPAQAARLFEALLEFQEERRNKQSLNTRNKINQDFPDDDVAEEIDVGALLNQRYGQGNLLDSRISCHSCGARCHRIDADYCFSCGEKL